MKTPAKYFGLVVGS